jgi:hypothetical protein
MSAEENKAVVRREQEELWNHTGDLDAWLYLVFMPGLPSRFDFCGATTTRSAVDSYCCRVASKPSRACLSCSRRVSKLCSGVSSHFAMPQAGSPCRIWLASS